MVTELHALYSPDTVRKVYNLVKSIMEHAIDNDLLPRTPCRRISLPVLRHTEKRFLTRDEVRRLADAIPEPYQGFVTLGAATGLRPGELYALQVSRIDLMHESLRVEKTLQQHGGQFYFEEPKNRRRRTVSIPRSVASLLGEHLEAFPPGKDGLIFTAPTGGPIDANNFRRRVWEPAVAASIGLEFDIHGLRHTHAAHLIAVGVDLLVLRNRLGHKSVQITLDHYGHLFEGRDRSAAELLDAAYEQAGVGILLGSPAAA